MFYKIIGFISRGKPDWCAQDSSACTEQRGRERERAWGRGQMPLMQKSCIKADVQILLLLLHKCGLNEQPP